MQFYLFDNFLFRRPSSNVPLIIGKITIEINATDNLSGMNRVELYIDDLQTANISDPPYLWLWNERTFFRHKIKVIAYDNAGNRAIEEIQASKFF